MEETTPRCDCGLIAGPWANGGAPLAGGRGMVMDRFHTEIVRSFPVRVLPSWRIGKIDDTGVQGFARRDVERKARRIPGHRFRPTLGSVTTQQRPCRRSFRAHTPSPRTETRGASSLQSAFNALCLPRVARHDTSLLYLSLTRRRAVSHTGRLGPHGATSKCTLLPRIVAIQGWEPRRDSLHLGARAGGTRFGIADSP